MRYFDCNCSYGLPRHPPFRYARTPEELEEELDFCGVEAALVYHAGMRAGSPALWNPRLAEDLAGRRRLHPTWALLPCQTGEQPPPEQLLPSLRDLHIGALWAFPNEHNYRLDGVTFGPLLEMLAARRIPLFVKLNAVALGDLMRECPRLTAIAVNQGPHSLERYLRPLFDTYPHLHLETSGLLVEGLIEEFCARYGAQRLLYGSAYPDNCSGGPLLRLARAQIDEESKRAVAGGNLERLLKEARW